LNNSAQFEIETKIPFARHRDERRPRRDGEIEEAGAKLKNGESKWIQRK
jgi:hypothetical protein